MTAQGNFHVYKSSAGSGKTHTLTMVYLSIVLKRPADFRHILAITFTNKAAHEIKQRIVDTLKFLASADIPSLSGYDLEKVDQLCAKTGLDSAQLQENAQQALVLILHHYHDFAISTIDSFVHRIIRTFAFDLKLMSNFEVEMDTDMLLSLTVSRVLADAGRDRDLTGILVNYIEDQAGNDENWQIDKLLTDFGKNLFNESARPYVDRIGVYTPDRIRELHTLLSGYIRNFHDELKSLGKQAIDLIEKNHISPDVFYRKKTGIYGYFINPMNRLDRGQPNSYVLDTVENDKWTAANNKLIQDEEALMGIKGELLAIYLRMEKLIEVKNPKSVLYGVIRNNLYPMAVLSALSDRLAIVLKERNVVPIAEFNRIISEIVMNEPVPFIYERTGEKFRHFLVDEFQDTSVMQWMNLLPLLDNALASGYINMIVGDGKQAIYRWRNGDADQFVNLPGVNNPSVNPMITQRAASLDREYNPSELSKNWRSRREIVEFNNEFFAFAAEWFPGENQKYYNEVVQDADPVKTGGLVTIKLYDGPEKEYKENMCSQILEAVNENILAGYQPGDICILVRTNADGQLVASFLTEAGIKVVSSDSLLLGNSPEVQFLLSWFRLLLNAADTVSAAQIVEYLFSRNLLGDAARHTLLQQTLNASSFYNLLQSNGFEVNRKWLYTQAMFDQAQILIRLFDLNNVAPLYMQFFLDQVLAISMRNDAGLQGFLDFWEQSGEKLSVVLPASADAVQIMTIHKAKGLEFPVVIAAFVDYSIKSGREYSWVDLDDPLIPDVHVAMIKLTKQVLNTKFASLFEEEKAKSQLDLLNVLYVTLTRPSERLFVFTGKVAAADKETENKSMSDLFAAFYQKKQLDPYSTSKMTLGSGNYIRGREWKPADALFPEFLSTAWQPRLIIASRAPAHWLANDPGGLQAEGLMVHEALQYILVAEDVQPAIQKLLNEGIITSDQGVNLEKHLTLLMNHDVAKTFFQPGVQIINEAEILTKRGKSYRPDRVVVRTNSTEVIDYKTGNAHDSHLEQVREYARLLTAMGYPQVKAWLIYLGGDIKVTAA